MDNEHELQNSQTPAEEPEIETLPEDADLESLVEADALKDALKKEREVRLKVVEQNKRLFERAKKAEEKFKLAQPSAIPKQEPAKSAAPSWDDFDRVNLKVSGYSDDEIDAVLTFAKGKGKRANEVVNDPFVQAAVGSMREKAKAVQATPPPSDRVQSTFSGKTWDKLSEADKAANWEQHLKGARLRG